MASAARAYAQFNPWLNSSKLKFKTKLFLFPKILINISRIFWLYRSFAKLSKCTKCFEIIRFFFSKLVFNLWQCAIIAAVKCTPYTVHMVSCLYSTVQLINNLANKAPSCWRYFKLDNYVYSVDVKTTEMLYLVQYCFYQKLSKNKVPLKLKNKATSLSDIFWSELN